MTFFTIPVAENSPRHVPLKPLRGEEGQPLEAGGEQG